MANELASVSETVDLSPQEASNRARAFLTEQGYNVAHHTLTTLTVERYVPDDAGEQAKRTLTVLIQPQREGGVRIKVVGNDAEGVHERQAEWLGWSESLPKREPDEPQAEPLQKVSEAQQDGVLAVAEGVNGRVELSPDRVRIKRKDFWNNKEKIKAIPIQHLAAVELKRARSLWPGDIEFVLADRVTEKQARSVEYQVVFTVEQSESFEGIKRAVEQRIMEEESRDSAKVPTEKSEPAQTPASFPAAFTTAKPETHSSSSSKLAMPQSNTPSSNVAGGIEILNRKLRKLVERNTSEGESVEFCLISPNIAGWTQAIVALNDRLLVIKPGMAAGATFGARVTSFYYRDINGIEVNTGLMGGVIEINTPSYQGTTQKDFWSMRDKDKNPNQLTNCLPIVKSDLKHYKRYLDRLRVMIRDAKQERVISPSPLNESSLSSELEKLASLRASGVLTDEEFQHAKQRLLNQ